MKHFCTVQIRLRVQMLYYYLIMALPHCIVLSYFQVCALVFCRKGYRKDIFSVIMLIHGNGSHHKSCGRRVVQPGWGGYLTLSVPKDTNILLRGWVSCVISREQLFQCNLWGSVVSGSTVAMWLAPLPSSTKVIGSNPNHGTTCLPFECSLSAYIWSTAKVMEL